MASDAKKSAGLGVGTANTTRKTVRFTTETTKDILELPTWRKAPEPQRKSYVLSARGQVGLALISFAVSKMLFIRLPTARRAALEAYRARLLSLEQLAAWWPSLSASNQALISHSPISPTTNAASSFCETFAELSERSGNQAVSDLLAPFVIPVISSWELLGEIASVDHSNRAAEVAAREKKAGNALGNARSGCLREYEKRVLRYETYEDPELEPAQQSSRFTSVYVPIQGTDLEECILEFVTSVNEAGACTRAILGAGIASQREVAHELAAEQALANWHICEETLKGRKQVELGVKSYIEKILTKDIIRLYQTRHVTVRAQRLTSTTLLSVEIMFASPAPSAARSRRAAQPAIRQNQTSRRASAAIRASTSRLTTPAIRASHGSPSEDQDMLSEASFGTVTAPEAAGIPTYVKTPELSVTFSGHFPEEVRRTLGSSEVNRNASTGSLDSVTGYAFLVTYDTCFVWNPTKRSHGSPTCYIFPTPGQRDGGASASHLLLPNVSLIPYGSSREPGLLMVSSTGEIRLWESINAGLAGADQFYSSVVSVSAGEYVSNMYRCEASFYVLATTSGRLLRMALSSPGGKSHVAIAPFAQHQGLLSFSRFFGRSNADKNSGSVVAVAETASETRQARSKNIWALTEKTLQKWTIGDGWEQLVIEYDVRTPIESSLVPEDQDTSENPELDTTLHDLKMLGNEHILVLFSYLSPAELESTNTTPNRTYAIASFAPSGEGLAPQSIDKVPYEGVRDPRPASNPKLALIDSGNVAFVQFVDAVTLQSLNTGSTFKTHLLFKDRRWNRTLGFGIMDKPSSNSTTAELMLMTVTSGQLNVQLDLSKIKRVDDLTKVKQLRAVMEQAIRFGTIQDNPFIFRLDPELKEADLGGAAVGLSRDILRSEISESRQVMDLSQHISKRFNQLQALMRFLNEDRATSHMSDYSRQSLAADAEKLCAAGALWQFENENAGQHQKSLLAEAIERYIAETSDPIEDGPVRTFFKSHLEDIGAIVRNADDIVDEAYRNAAPNLVEIVRAANQIVLLLCSTVEVFRQRNLGFYGLETTQPSLIPWMSEQDVLDSMQELFTHTGRMLGDRARDLGNALKTVPAERALQNELKGQLQALAKYLFAGYSERLEYLQRRGASAEDKKEASALDQQFTNYRPSMLRNLATYDQGEDAFRLAEQYRDFRSLAELCNDSRLANNLRTQNYLEQYQQDFASELYQWYVEHGKLQVLLLQDQIYYPLLQGFLKSTDYPRISWLHDVAIGDFHSATATLSEEVGNESKVDARQLLLSLSKLSTVAEHDLEKYNSQDVQAELQEFDDQLDLVELQREMREEFEQIVAESNVRGRPSIDMQAEILAQELVPPTVEAANVALFKRLAKQLLQRNVLSSYDLVDIMTLRMSKPGFSSITDAGSVLERTPADDDALRTLWRRAWIVDDWIEVRDQTTQTDEQIWRNIQQTAVWQLIVHMVENKTERLMIPPSQAAIIPTSTALSNRFPDLPTHAIDALLSDLELEEIKLRRLLDSGDVEEWYAEAVQRVTKAAA